MITAIIIQTIFQFILSCYVMGVTAYHIGKLKTKIANMEKEIETLKQPE